MFYTVPVELTFSFTQIKSIFYFWNTLYAIRTVLKSYLFFQYLIQINDVKSSQHNIHYFPEDFQCLLYSERLFWTQLVWVFIVWHFFVNFSLKIHVWQVYFWKKYPQVLARNIEWNRLSFRRGRSLYIVFFWTYTVGTTHFKQSIEFLI